MKTFSNFSLIETKKLFILSLFPLFFGCPSDDDCTKIITIPHIYFVGNQSYTYETEQEVDCDLPEPTEPELIEAPVLENFTYQILDFNYVPETSNNTTLLQYQIELSNHNDYDVSGFPKLTVESDGIEISGHLSVNAIEPCYEISANSNCILVVDNEFPIENILPSATYNIINVEYIEINE